MTMEEEFQKCTIRIDASGSRGTGFFVAPQLILTCAHVVGKNESVNLFWKVTQQKYIATVEKIFEFPIDLALLKLDHELEHPYVELDSSSPEHTDQLHIFGYPRDEGIDYPDGDSVTFDYGGEAFKKEIKLYNLQFGRILEGFSGSPLLNLNTGKVVGIVHLSNDLGGRAISAEVILQILKRYFDQQKTTNLSCLIPVWLKKEEQKQVPWIKENDQKTFGTPEKVKQIPWLKDN